MVTTVPIKTDTGCTASRWYKEEPEQDSEAAEDGVWYRENDRTTCVSIIAGSLLRIESSWGDPIE